MLVGALVAGAPNADLFAPNALAALLLFVEPNPPPLPNPPVVAVFPPNSDPLVFALLLLAPKPPPVELPNPPVLPKPPAVELLLLLLPKPPPPKDIVAVFR